MSEAEQLLKNLVEGLNDTFWSSWQGTWKFDEQLFAANDYLNEKSKVE